VGAGDRIDVGGRHEKLRPVRSRCDAGHGLVVTALVLALVACANDVPATQSRSSVERADASTTGTVPNGATRSSARSSSSAAGLSDLLDELVGAEAGGVAALSVHDGVTTTAAAGVADNSGQPTTAMTPFRVGSISKPFVAAMILQLVDEDRVELDAPLSTYLPETPVGADVTIRALLSHRSGLRNYTDGPLMNDALTDRSHRFSPAEIIGYVESVPSSKPDRRFSYSNTNYILLGQVIEQLDATDLNTALQQRIVDPLGLVQTRFATAEDPSPLGVAAGWSTGVVDGDPDADYTSIATSAWAAGALVSTVTDLSAFLTALFARALISEGMLEEMTDVGSGGSGLGLFVGSLEPGQPAFGHNGAINGYTATMAIDPSTGDTIVVLTNNDSLVADDIATQIIDTW
jgi:D-alanyl-D-alanine carboxypeptidase